MDNENSHLVSSGFKATPDTGYLDPDPECKHCSGKGFQQVSYPAEKDVEAVFVGICPNCKSENGFHFQFKGCRPPYIEPHDGFPPCMDDDCPTEYCEWIELKD